MYDCDFSNAYDIPKIVNFMIALSKEIERADVDAVNKFTNRNVLSISFFWSKEISQQQKYEDSMESHIIYGGLDNID